jgi:hypothetical protein
MGLDMTQHNWHWHDGSLALVQKARIKDERRLTSARWLNGLGSKNQQSKGIEDQHWCNGSTALSAKSKNQKRQIDGRVGLGACQCHKLQSKRVGGGQTSQIGFSAYQHHKHT